MSTLRTADHVSAVPRGGAFHAAMQLMDALQGAGIGGRMWHDPRRVSPADPRCAPLPWSTPRGLSWLRWRRRKVRLNRRWRRAMRGREPGREPVHPVRSSREIRYDPRLLRGDVLHLHWLGDAVFDWDTFFSSLPPGKPVVWTQHDFHGFTGGCSYPGHCDRYRTRCENCPLVLDPGPQDLAAEGFRWKRRHYRKYNLHLVAPSTWLRERIAESALGRLARSVHRIPNTYDLGAFYRAERLSARRRLGLEDDATVLTFGADSVTSRRKGARELLDALARLATTRPIRLIVFGGGEMPGLDNLPGLLALGPLTSQESLADAYAAADAFCMPSLEDNLPTTGIEALGAGTPVVAFAGTGAADYVVEGRTGWLAAHGSAEDLARQIALALDHQRSERAYRVEDLRSHIRGFCDPGERAAEYLAVYAEACRAGGLDGVGEPA